MHAVLSFSDMSRLDEYNITANNKLAFDVAEKVFGIVPIMHAADMTTCGKIDQLSIVVYLTQIRSALTEKDTPAGNDGPSLEAFIIMKGTYNGCPKYIIKQFVAFMYDPYTWTFSPF